MFSSNLSRLGLDVTRISSTTVTAEAHTGAKKGSSSRTGNTSNLCACVRACVDDHVSSLKCVCVRSSKRVDFNYTEMALFIPGVLVQRLQLPVPGTVHTHVNHTHTHTQANSNAHTRRQTTGRAKVLCGCFPMMMAWPPLLEIIKLYQVFPGAAWDYGHGAQHGTARKNL